MTKLSIYLRLSELPPLPQRLRELLAAFAGWGYEAVYLDWGRRFPWTLDERFRNEVHYAEELVAGVYGEARAAGLVVNTVFPSPGSLGHVAAVPAYHHLFRSVGGRALLDLNRPPARKFYEDLIDDFVGVVPNPGGVMLEWCSSGTTPDDAAYLTGCFRSRGFGVIARCARAMDGGWAGLPEPLRRFDAVVVPAPARPRNEAIREERLIPSMRVVSSRERSRAEAFIRTVDGEGGGAEGEARDHRLLLLFQSEVEARRRGHAGAPGVLAASIEPALDAVREIGGRSPGRRAAGIGLVAPDCARPARELERRLGAAWGSVRGMRECLAAGDLSRRLGRYPQGQDELVSLRTILRKLDRDRREVYRLVAVLVDELSPYVEPRPLEQALRSIAAALTEEYRLLSSRMAPFESGAGE